MLKSWALVKFHGSMVSEVPGCGVGCMSRDDLHPREQLLEAESGSWLGSMSELIISLRLWQIT